MRILYAAIDQRVPGTKGGSTHVAAVASGLAALGHEVHVAAARGAGPWPDGRVVWHAMAAPAGRPHLRLLRAPRLARLARAVRPHIVIERYHNFGGEGALAARASGAALVLEVNAPIVDYPGSLKARLDRAVLVEPMRRWREWQCHQAALVVTPVRDILPAWVPADRILEIEWGADPDRFRPDAGGAVPFAREPGEIVVVFAGAFRAWHGARRLAEALVALQARGHDRLHGVFIGDGPEMTAVRRAAAGLRRVTFTGPLPHEAMPAALAAADVGAAPFDVAAHPPLRLGFYWSPLKVFEYMAAGLPVVAPRIPRLARLVEDGVEGVLYDPDDRGGLEAALVRLEDASRRAWMGRAARARAAREYSWQEHCRALDEALRATLARVGGG